MWLIDLGLFLGSALVAAALTRLVIWLGHHNGWLDYPDARKRHPRPVPRLGGVAVFTTFWAFILGISLCCPKRLSIFAPDAAIVFTGALAVFATGLVDDFHPLRARYKLAVQTGVGLWLWSAGLGIGQVWIPTVGGVDLELASLPVTLFWFLLLVNAVNIIDGLDALAGLVSLIGLAAVALIGFRVDVPDIILLSLILAGALAGFLVYNRPPARLFLGDCGSLFLGYFFAVAALWLPIKRYTVVAVYVPLLAMLVPISEAGWSVVRRVLHRRKPTDADRGHLHFRLMDLGLSENGVRWLYGGLAAIGFGFSLAAAYGDRRLWMGVFGFFVLLLVAGMYIVLRSPRRKRQEDE